MIGKGLGRGVVALVIGGGGPAAAAAHAGTTIGGGGAPWWPWALGGIVIAAALAVLFARRARRHAELEESWGRPTPFIAPAPAQEETMLAYVIVPPAGDPLATPAPPAIVPVPAEVVPDDAPFASPGVEPGTPAAADLAVLTGDPVDDDRPWIEFAFRPLAGGVVGDEAQVRVELTVANAGGGAAADVRVAATLRDGVAASIAQPFDLSVGEGRRIEALLTAPADAATSEPLLLVEAQYRLPGGAGARTAARFRIGLAGEGDALMPLADTLRDDVDARLLGDPERS